MAAEFEWDGAKAASNLAKHGLSFADAVRIFNDPGCAILATSRPADKEGHFKAIGRIGARIYTVVFTDRGDVKRVISARRANPPEEKRYGDRSLHTRPQ